MRTYVRANVVCTIIFPIDFAKEAMMRGQGPTFRRWENMFDVGVSAVMFSPMLCMCSVILKGEYYVQFWFVFVSFCVRQDYVRSSFVVCQLLSASGSAAS